MDTGNKNWATEYLLDPLNAPDPSQETGPGSSFRPDGVVSPVKAPPAQTPNRLSKAIPSNKTSPLLKKDRSRPTTPTSGLLDRGKMIDDRKCGGYPSPPVSASGSPRSPHLPSTNSPRSPGAQSSIGHHKRVSSLNERFPGDMSHRPLDQLSREKALADKSRNSTKKHLIQPDTIDNLDTVGIGPYHHSGPYDATLLARNNSTDSPLAALQHSNAETLKATPKENIIDAIEKHRPLDGVAVYPPGTVDRLTGQRYDYEQGENMMIDNNPEGGAYRRYPGIQYHPDDIKGKGEPSYSIEKAFKEHKINDEKYSDYRQNMADSIEMTSNHQRTASSRVDEEDANVRRTGSLSKRLSGSGAGLKKRFGSLKKKVQQQSE